MTPVINAITVDVEDGPANPEFQLAIAIWQKLPLALTMRVGPLIVRVMP